MKAEKIIGGFDLSGQSYMDKQKNPERVDLNKLKLDVESKNLYGEYNASAAIKPFVLKEEINGYPLRIAFLLLLHCLNANQKVFAVFHKFKEENAKKTGIKLSPDEIKAIYTLIKRQRIGELNKVKSKKVKKDS